MLDALSFSLHILFLILFRLMKKDYHSWFLQSILRFICILKADILFPSIVSKLSLTTSCSDSFLPIYGEIVISRNL